MASPLLLSSQVYTQLDDATRVKFSRVGLLGLKGKKDSIEAWGIGSGSE